ncbi:AAA family ATPase [Clostridium sp. YIM B02505]|uniref:AAA family ATPase n=1 Tax=Clostridium yunnanense TaxID=2800325 RepID=A0ABS1EL93_9CLOT|nr:AAA family ATPase [Clostridium yunnanense]MBK1810123.1 AAA family ATPase [Clostridium yunnanense]
MKKYLMLIGSPPACGKTYVANEIAKRLPNPVYLDKDTVIPLSKMIYKAANEPYNRDSAFFKEYVRNAEYEAIMDIAFEALPFNTHVMVNAPFAKEFRDEIYINNLKEKLKAHDAELVQVWVHCDIEVCHQRMIERASDRDTWKLENWDEYVSGQDFSKPEVPGIHIVDNSGSEKVQNDIEKLLKVL